MNGEPEVLNYDVLVLCTGTTYNQPWRGDDDKLLTHVDRENDWKNMRESVKNASSILCIGAGPTGIETSTWMKECYPDKKVGIAMRGKILLAGLNNAHPLAEAALKQIGVNIHPGTNYSTGTKILTPDSSDPYALYIDCRGFKFLGPAKYMQETISDCVDKKSGQILVNEFCQVTNKHPLAANHSPANPVIHHNIFSYGDVSLTPRAEVKCIVSMIQYLSQICNNILEVAQGTGQMQPIPTNLHTIQMVPMGSKDGLFVFNGMVKRER
jgi:NADH dehydrogenase FAD-containing subunit